PDEAGEADLRAGVDIGERVGRHLDHVAGALLEAADLAGRLRDGTADLTGQLLGDLVLVGDEPVDGLRADLAAFGHRHMLPGRLRLARSLHRLRDLGAGRELALDVDAAVDRADGFLSRGRHEGSSPMICWAQSILIVIPAKAGIPGDRSVASPG